MGNPLRTILENLRKPPDNYIRSMMPFLEFDLDKMKKSMKLVKTGKKRGEKDQPPTESESLDDVEQTILTTINTEKKSSHQTYLDHLRAYSDRLRSLNFEVRVSQIETSASNAIAEFRTQMSYGKDYLYQLRRQVVEIEKEVENFRKENNLERTAHIPKSRLLHFSFVLMLLLLETVLNGYFLARGSEFGILGGVLEALSIAAINVGLGFMVGKWIPPNIFHKGVFRKILGYALTGAYLLAVLGFNLLVAHYRDALGGDLPAEAPHLALETFLAAPFMVADFKSWMMVALGFFFSILATVGSFKMDDPYPGYGNLERRRTMILNDYTETKLSLIDELTFTKDVAAEKMDGARKDIADRKSECLSIINGRESMKVSYQHHLDYLQSCTNELFTLYRESNRQSRKTHPPNHFSELPTLSIPQSPKIVTFFDENIDNVNKDVKKTNAILKKNVDLLFEEYRQAVESYKQIEQLTLEEIDNASPENL